jgi:hypothetical protein
MAVPPAAFGLDENVPRRRLAQCASASLDSVLRDSPPFADRGLAALSSESGSFTAWPLESHLSSTPTPPTEFVSSSSTNCAIPTKRVVAPATRAISRRMRANPS